MARYFNTTGPCVAAEHYMLPARARCIDLMEPIVRKQYFVIHAARQTGKTTMVRDLMRELNRGTQYYVLYCSLETVEVFTDPERGIPAIVRSIAMNVEIHPQLKSAGFARNRDLNDVNNIIQLSFMDLCAALDRPLVVIFDEADCLSEGTLITFLRQIRSGYVNRDAAPFIHSLALVGMRNLRDYRSRIRERRQTLGSASPFNIVSQALTLRNFTSEEISALYGQHTTETGQVFPPEACAKAWEWSQGQPWLVNALALEVVDGILERDYGRTIAPEHMDQAAEQLIQRRDTHVQSLLDKLVEERVRRIIEPMMAGEADVEYLSEDHLFVRDLGLIREDQGRIMPANPIYAEVIARTLTYNAQQRLPHELIHRWMDEKSIQMNELLAGFQEFWRENSEPWTRAVPYREVETQLVLMAWLQRVVNGGARILREFASGSGRIDLCVLYQDKKYPIEIKVWRDSARRDPRPAGLVQLGQYMDTVGSNQGWLIVFDLRSGRTWDERIYRQDETMADGKLICLFGA